MGFDVNISFILILIIFSKFFYEIGYCKGKKCTNLTKSKNNINDIEKETEKTDKEMFNK